MLNGRMIPPAGRNSGHLPLRVAVLSCSPLARLAAVNLDWDCIRAVDLLG